MALHCYNHIIVNYVISVILFTHPTQTNSMHGIRTNLENGVFYFLVFYNMSDMSRSVSYVILDFPEVTHAMLSFDCL